MAPWGYRMTAALGVVVSVGTSVVVNVLTDKWSFTLWAGLGILVLVGVALAVVSATSPGPPGRTTSQTAWLGGKIRRSRMKTRGSADVKVTAGAGGKIENSGVDASKGRVGQRAFGGTIEDSPIESN
jgi:hypothetical protein